MRGRNLLAILLILTIASALSGIAQTSQRASASKQPTPQVKNIRPSYSIFEGTLVDLSWPEVKEVAESGALVLLPVGVIEEHGPHMSLGPDVYLSYEECVVLKQKLQERHVNAIIAPPLYWGVMQSGETGAYPGSFTVRPATLKALLTDILSDLKSWGFTRVYVVNRHGDRIHNQTISEAITEARQSLGLDFFEENKQPRPAGAPRPTAPIFKTETPFRPDFHAGAFETGLMAAYFPAEVNTEIAKTLKPQSTFQPLGYVGDPANYAALNVPVAVGMLDGDADMIAAWMKPKPEQK